MKKINFKVTPSGGTQVYAIRVNGEGINLNNGKGSKILKEGETHILQYYMLGTSGGKLKIEGKDAMGSVVVEVKKATIPSGNIRHANQIKFDL